MIVNIASLYELSKAGYGHGGDCFLFFFLSSYTVCPLHSVCPLLLYIVCGHHANTFIIYLIMYAYFFFIAYYIHVKNICNNIVENLLLRSSSPSLLIILLLLLSFSSSMCVIIIITIANYQHIVLCLYLWWPPRQRPAMVLVGVPRTK